MFIRLQIILLVVLFGCIFTAAKSLADQPIPLELIGVGIDDKTGSQLDLGLTFTNEKGEKVRLKEFLTKTQKPVILALVYFECPNLCTLVLNSTVDTIKDINLNAGHDFEVLAISFNPKEKYTLAAEKKAAYVNEYLKTKRPGDVEKGFNFWVGNDANISKLTNQLGFKYKWDNEINQYAHASAIYIITPTGQISRLFYGLMYPPHDVKLALIEAGQGKIGSVMDKILLFCYHYDATAKKYVLVAQKMMTVGAAIFLAILAIFMAIFWKKEILKNKKQPNT